MKILRSVVSIFLLILLGLTALFALHWRYYHDAPIYFYISWLIEKFGAVPYRDVYEFNMPGTFLAYFIFSKLTASSVLGVRILDYILLAINIFLGWLWMRKLSGWAGLMGGAAWGLVYLSLGPTMMLQREFILMIPLLCGLAAYTNVPANRSALRFLLTGLFLGVAATIKPQAFIGLLPIFAMEWRSAAAEPDPTEKKRRLSSLRRIALWLAVGFFIPWAIAFIYLAANGALAKFFEIVVNYLPLFAQMGGNHQVLTGLGRVFYLITTYGTLGGYGIWLAPALLGIFLLQQASELAPEKKRQALLLLLLVIVFSIYPVFSGQFFPQHWLPFVFLLLQAAFLCLTVDFKGTGALLRALPAAVLLVACISLVRPDTLYNFHQLIVARELPAANDPKEGRVDEMAAFLEANLRPGDTVQPLDWVGGAVHAMLIARVRIATPFIYDEYFYHGVNTSYIQGLRRQFMADLNSAMPRFVVEVYDDGPYSEPSGPNTSRDFPELRAFLAENYSVVKEGQGYRIYELQTN